MNAIIPQARTEDEAARARMCPLCLVLPGAPCQADPPGMHLARFLDAHIAGKLSLAYLGEVLAEMIVISPSQIIPSPAGPCADEHPARRGGFWQCTRPAGHPGTHWTEGPDGPAGMHAIWPQDGGW